MEEEFISNQERLKPQEEKHEVNNQKQKPKLIHIKQIRI